MTDDLRDLEEIIDLCVKKNVKRIKLPDLELEFGGDGGMPVAEAIKELKFPDKEMHMPTDDELLNWSTPLTQAEEPKPSNGEA